MLHICRNFKHSQTVKTIRAHELRLMTALQWRLNAPNAFEVAETLHHLLLHFLKTENTTARCADAVLNWYLLGRKQANRLFYYQINSYRH